MWARRRNHAEGIEPPSVSPQADGSCEGQRHHVTSRMHLTCTSGSVGGLGGRPPRSTRPHLQAAHVRCPWVVTWDDHEFENNNANDISERTGVDPAEFLKRRANAYKAYYEAMPLRHRSVPHGPHMKLYRTIPYGRLATFQVLDTRQYRTDQPNGDGLAERNDDALNPNNTILGARQANWLKAALLRSTGPWNVLAQQVMMGMSRQSWPEGQTARYAMDQWPGYAAERMRLVRFLADRRVSNPVVLTGDIHSNWVNDLRVNDRKPEQPVVAAEFVGTSITSGGNGTAEVKDLDALFAANPCVGFHNRQRGYVRWTITPWSWTSDYRIVEDVKAPGAAADAEVVRRRSRPARCSSGLSSRGRAARRIANAPGQIGSCGQVRTADDGPATILNACPSNVFGRSHLELSRSPCPFHNRGGSPARRLAR